METNQKSRRIINTIENVRNQKLIGSSLETEIYIYVKIIIYKILKNMKKILMVSKFIFLEILMIKSQITL